jgi:hypothetical protein
MRDSAPTGRRAALVPIEDYQALEETGSTV